MAFLLAHSGWHHGWFWLWPLVPLAWLLAFLVLARLVFRRGPGGGRPWERAAADPRAILAERYARGEITSDEYRERLGNLQP